MVSFNNTTEQLISPSIKYGSRTAIAIISGLITAIGIPGNILVILTICRVKKMRSTQNLFLANLAFGDFMNLIWCLPIWVLSIYVPWPFGEFACKYIHSLNQVITTSTVFTMVSNARSLPCYCISIQKKANIACNFAYYCKHMGCVLFNSRTTFSIFIWIIKRVLGGSKVCRKSENHSCASPKSFYIPYYFHFTMHHSISLCFAN